MLFRNLNFLLGQRGALLLSAQAYLSLNPDELIELVDQLGVPFEILSTIDLERKNELLKSLDLRMLVLDVDGVMTNGGLLYSGSGEEFKQFNVKDGMGITRLIASGVEVGIISASLRSEVVKHRAALLGIQQVYVGKTPKEEVLEGWLYTAGLGFEQVAYIGDDVNDIALLKRCGLSACPADAVYAAKRAAKVVLQKRGGEGCVREFIDQFLLKDQF